MFYLKIQEDVFYINWILFDVFQFIFRINVEIFCDSFITEWSIFT